MCKHMYEHVYIPSIMIGVVAILGVISTRAPNAFLLDMETPYKSMAEVPKAPEPPEGVVYKHRS